ncbi:MAG: (Fe-S)-binding protein [Vampirovibrionales bacterium]|nr:(Fe-S)-binding protein [Vampirovibrionales bacterium]
MNNTTPSVHIEASSVSEAVLDIDKLNACVHCGLCLPTCATYRATGSEVESPRGRLYLMRKWLEGSLEKTEQIKPHLDQCLACHACETVCPSGVQYGDLLFQSRAHLAKSDKSLKRWFKRFIFKSVLPNSKRLNLLRKSLRLYQQSGLQSLLRKTGVLNLIPGLAYQEKLLPEVPVHYQLKPGMRFGDSAHPLVALMTGCVMDAFFNPIHWQTIFVLVKNGYQVLIPEQTCCGALAHHAGETDIASTLAEKNVIPVMKDNPVWIVLNSAGCGSSMQHYEKLLPAHPMAQGFSAKVIDIMALLEKQPLLSFPEQSLKRRLLYQAACHLYHVQKIQAAPQAVLSQIPNTEVLPLEDLELCCGSAGIYNLEYPELADEMLALKIQAIKKTLEKASREGFEADTLVSGNPGCLMQLQKGLRDEAIELALKHPIALLAEAYGYQGIGDTLSLLCQEETR